MTDSTPKNQTIAGQTSDESASSEAGGGARSTNRRPANWLFLALAVALVAGVAFFKHGPQSASASLPGTAGGASPVDESFGAELAGIKNVDRALGSADTMINDFKFAPARVQVPLTGLNVNPFKSTGANASPIDLQDDPATQDLREQERQSAVQAVQSLKLQSITHGTNKRICMINSVRYQEGQEAGGFVVEEIASNMVVVRKGAYRFELKPSM